MTIDWDCYVSFDPGVYGVLQELDRRQARAAFKHLMKSKAERIAALRTLLRANGVDLDGPDALSKLNDWFVRSVERNPDKPTHMRNIWYSVVTDIALYMGDRLIERAPNLEWRMFTHGKRHPSYQRAVVMGFSKARYKNYCVDFGMLVAMYGHRIVGRRDEDPAYFQKLFDAVLAEA